MSVEMIAFFMFTSMLLLLLTGREIFAVIGGVGTIAALFLWGLGGEDMPFIAGYSFMKWSPLLVIPLFVFMGLTLQKSGMADKLFHAIYIWMGRVKGGLGMGTVGLCALIATMSGESAAGTVTAGTIALPSMLKRGYNKRMVTGLVQAGGALGFLIPPSIVFILYGMIAKVSIGQLWLAGAIPGLILATLYIVYIGIRCALNPSMGPPIPVDERASWGEKLHALVFGVPPLILIFLVLGLLFMGVTTIIECGAIGALGALILAAMNRRLNWGMMREILDETMMISSMFIWIFVTAILFSAVFDGLGAIHIVEKFLNSLAGGNRWGIMIIMQLSFFLMGMVLDDTAMLLIVAPLYIPIVKDLGFSPVWYGVLYVLNCQIAYLTPPFGYNLFIMRGIVPKDSGITMGIIYRSVIPFVILQIICLILVMVFPQLALWLPEVFFANVI